jgi:hypothetical protein
VVWEDDSVDGVASETWRSELQGGALVELQVRTHEGGQRGEKGRRHTCHMVGPELLTLAHPPSLPR